MRYRPFGPGGDYSLGVAFLTDSSECVAQAVLTRLKLWLGEFFLDVSDGTPYMTKVLVPMSGASPDAAIQQRILGTPHVKSISAYNSVFDGRTRQFIVNATVITDFGPVTISEVMQ